MTRRLLSVLLAAFLSLSACAPTPPQTQQNGEAATNAAATPPEGTVAADDTAKQLAEALTALEVSKLAMQSAAAEAQDELQLIYAGMDDIHPQVSVDEISYDAATKAAKVTLKHSLPVGKEPWTFDTTATLKWVDDQWRLEWTPSIVHPQLTTSSRMRRTVMEAPRAAITDSQGVALVEEISLYEVGIDKSQSKPEQWPAAAEQLANLMSADPAAYTKKVQDGGPKQFVIAATVRQVDIPPEVSEVPGILVREITATVGPHDGFAASLLGTVGHPTQQMIDKSEGKLSEQDTVGLSGLQSRYDEQLRGVPGVRVELVARKGVEEFDPVVAFVQETSVGSPIQLSLNRDAQDKAENVLAGQSSIASLVVLDNATGAVVAAANSPAAGAYPHGTFGKYAPGSTFKLASALAMLRKGMTAESSVECSSEHQVSGHTFGNYSGYSNTGKITLADAVAYSCNTVFTRAAENVSADELAAAAGSLGIGIDYEAGFRSYFGKVEPNGAIDRAASMIGQGQVTVSPLAMAALAASIAKGQTVIPWLVKGHEAKSTATPLTETEATELRKMMAAVVDHGTGTMLKGVVKGAKSGTAEFGPQGQQQTHAWMIAFTETQALAAFVEVGDSGGTVAAPLIKAFLS